MNISEALADLLEAKSFAMSYQEYCENFPALVTEAKYNELTVEVCYNQGDK
jgi:hypothetical protein